VRGPGRVSRAATTGIARSRPRTCGHQMRTTPPPPRRPVSRRRGYDVARSSAGSSISTDRPHEELPAGLGNCTSEAMGAVQAPYPHEIGFRTLERRMVRQPLSALPVEMAGLQLVLPRQVPSSAHAAYSLDSGSSPPRQPGRPAAAARRPVGKPGLVQPPPRRPHRPVQLIVTQQFRRPHDPMPGHGSGPLDPPAAARRHRQRPAAFSLAGAGGSAPAHGSRRYQARGRFE
jgi:hypothetical protein